PAAITVPVGRTQFFVAGGATSWTVEESDGGSVESTGDAYGAYAAPLKPGVYHVTASNGTASGTATVTVVSYTLSVVAGKLGGGGNLDDTGAQARFNRPTGLAYD